MSTKQYHPSQINEDGSLKPQWPAASHFKDWHYLPFTVNNKPVDLYFWDNRKEQSWGSMHDLLIGIQLTDEDGDYISPFIESGNALHHIYVDNQRNDVLAAYLLACTTLGITSSIAPRR